MKGVDYLQLVLLLLIIILIMKPLGIYLEKVLTYNAPTFLDFLLKPIENLLYKVCHIDGEEEQSWKGYLLALLGFSLVSLVVTSVLLAFQAHLPLNPQKLLAPSWSLNLNTAFSFMTSTDWQSYGGEKAMSYLSQMMVLAVQNFVAASVGLSTAAAVVRGIARKKKSTLGNFWVDLVRINLYLLLPLSIVAAVVFLACGVPQNFSPYLQANTLEGNLQWIAQGPVASQEAIKLLGTNGGGFFNVNSAHPYENPTPFSNFFQLILIFLIPSAQIYYFGRSIKNTKHAWYIFSALTFLLVLGVLVCAHCETIGNMEWSKYNLFGGNWEGKEQRFGIFGSALYACMTTAISCGAVNSMHDSFTPLGGLVPMLNMQLNEVIIGGVGAGLYNIILFILLSIFIAGLIIGRTPEYLGKKIESFDIKMTVLAILPYVLIVHLFTSLGCRSSWGMEGLGNTGPHGFSEILYAFSSATANNGSAFAGLSTNSVGFNLSLAIAMLLGRFLVIIPAIALAGSMVKKKLHPKSAASFPISSLVFISLLIGIIFLLGALTFFPALTMGPIIEQFYMLKGVLFS